MSPEEQKQFEQIKNIKEQLSDVSNMLGGLQGTIDLVHKIVPKYKLPSLIDGLPVEISIGINSKTILLDFSSEEDAMKVFEIIRANENTILKDAKQCQ